MRARFIEEKAEAKSGGGLQAAELRHCIIRMQGYGRSFRITAVH
jgi:hypothetical protein